MLAPMISGVRIAICCLALSATIAGSAAFADHVYTPAQGTAERKAILDALREPVGKELHDEDVVFVVRKLRVNGQWAFLEGRPQRSMGRPIDYSKTSYRDLVKEGLFDDWIAALLARNGDEWRVITYVIGATDYPPAGWAQQHQAPAELFD
jgi:hypothetical protein